MRSVLDTTKQALEEAQQALQAQRSSAPTDDTRVQTLEAELAHTRDEYSHIAQRVKAELQRVRDEHTDTQQRLDARVAELQQLEAKRAEELQRVRDAHAAETSQLRDAHAAEIAALRNAHAAETSRLREAQPAVSAAPPASKDAADLAQENEDLLVLLDELSTKHKRNKERMRLQGWDVSDDDDDDDDDEL